jgi:ethanolamine utilization protein EutQ
LNRRFETYLGDDTAPELGGARIARLVGPSNNTSMAGGIVIYEHTTVVWDLSFDEMITLLEGGMLVHSGGESYSLAFGDMAWFPAHTPLTYEVPERVVVSYAIWPMP